MQFSTHPFRVLSVALTLTACAHAQAQATRQRNGAPPDHGFTFVTINDVNNPAWAGNPHTGGGAGRGSVGHQYRIATTEVTAAQWLEFVEAYAPYAGYSIGVNFTGDFVFGTPQTDGTATYRVRTGFDNAPTTASWHMAARYVNWLHNDKALTQDAFESGAYDTATFTLNPDGTRNDQSTRSPGAKYWIPSYDEWIKAVYYDPNKGGPGQGGWWDHPGGSDAALFAALPGQGGETNGGLFAQFAVPLLFIPEVGMYPHVTSPWGLLDASGGVAEWTEEWNFDLAPRRRLIGGSHMFTSDQFQQASMDSINSFRFGSPSSSGLTGFRIASVIPSPGGVPLAMIVLAKARYRRRQR